MVDAARADFIDKDVVEAIEDFMKHAPLKNIKVELKRSAYKDQGILRAANGHSLEEAAALLALKKLIVTQSFEKWLLESTAWQDSGKLCRTILISSNACNIAQTPEFLWIALQ